MPEQVAELPDAPTRASRERLIRLLLPLASVVLTLCLLEIGVRLFLPVTDLPLSAYDPEVGVHRKPNQRGTRIVGYGEEINAEYTVNADGWNSTHTDYLPDKPEGVLRVAVIGDSYVEAMEVDVEDAFPARIEQRLAATRCNSHDHVEVYAFGTEGAPLSHHLNVMRYVAERYDPDVFVILVIHNDFDESLPGYGFHEHYMKVMPDGNGGFTEIPPAPFKPPLLRRAALRSALFRFLYGNLETFEVAEATALALRANFTGGREIPLQTVDLQAMTTYLVGQYQAVADQSDSRLLVIMDADRHNVYNGSGDPGYYNQMVRQAADQTGVDFVDLTDAFTVEYQAHHRPFNSSVDWHWNEYGHDVVSGVVVDWLQSDVCQTP